MSGFSNNSPDAGRITPAYVATPAIDTELRGFMLRVFNTMAGGLALTGVVAYGAAASGVYAAVAGTPLFWLIMSVPFGLALLLGFRIARMSPAAALYAAISFSVGVEILNQFASRRQRTRVARTHGAGAQQGTR